MTTFNPFSVEGKKWLEEHQVEDQFNSLENIGLSRTRSHSKSKMDINSDTDENIENQKNKNCENKNNVVAGMVDGSEGLDISGASLVGVYGSGYCCRWWC